MNQQIASQIIIIVIINKWITQLWNTFIKFSFIYMEINEFE